MQDACYMPSAVLGPQKGEVSEPACPGAWCWRRANDSTEISAVIEESERAAQGGAPHLL